MGKDIKSITIMYKCLSLERLDGLWVSARFLLAYLSTETTFLSKFNELFLKINTGQMPMSSRELSFSEANNHDLLLTHEREWTDSAVK